MNSAYDPDPLLGSGSLSGFNEWAAFYSHYRVVGFGYQFELANNESFPLIVVCAPTVVDVGANYSSTDQISEFPYGQRAMISAKTGADRCVLSGYVDIAKLEGTTEAIYDSTFSAVTTTNPAQPRYFNIGIGAPSVLVNGVTASVRLQFTVLFFARNNVPA
jgi:hypothetical protein